MRDKTGDEMGACSLFYSREEKDQEREGIWCYVWLWLNFPHREAELGQGAERGPKMTDDPRARRWLVAGRGLHCWTTRLSSVLRVRVLRTPCQAVFFLSLSHPTDGGIAWRAKSASARDQPECVFSPPRELVSSLLISFRIAVQHLLEKVERAEHRPRSEAARRKRRRSRKGCRR